MEELLTILFACSIEQIAIQIQDQDEQVGHLPWFQLTKKERDSWREKAKDLVMEIE